MCNNTPTPLTTSGTAGFGGTTMYRGHSTAVVIPAYNEEPFVADTIESVPKFVDRVYVVDDGSTDDTWQEIQSSTNVANERHDTERVVPIRHDNNRGVGAAIKTGYLRAREEAVSITAVMGGDGQMEPEMLGDLFDPIVDGRADYTKGNRFLGRYDRGDMPAFRFVGNTILAALTKVASGYWESGDPQSGYTAISLCALEAIEVESMYEFYGYCNDLLVKLNVAGQRVVDVPRPITYGDEESHIAYRTYVPKVSALLARDFFWRLKTKYVVFDFHPLIGAYAIGLIATLVSLLAGIWTLPGVGRFATPVVRGGIAVWFGLFGLLTLVLAMKMDMDANDHLTDTVSPAEREIPTGEYRTATGKFETHSMEDSSQNGDSATNDANTIEFEPPVVAIILEKESDSDDTSTIVASQIRYHTRDHLPGNDTAAD